VNKANRFICRETKRCINHARTAGWWYEQLVLLCSMCTPRTVHIERLKRIHDTGAIVCVQERQWRHRENNVKNGSTLVESRNLKGTYISTSIDWIRKVGKVDNPERGRTMHMQVRPTNTKGPSGLILTYSANILVDSQSDYM